MSYFLFDDSKREHLKPFTFTRSTADIRVGAFTIREKWEAYLKSPLKIITPEYLQVLYPFNASNKGSWYINSRYFPTKELTESIHHLALNCSFVNQLNGDIVAFYTNEKIDDLNTLYNYSKKLKTQQATIPSDYFLENRWDIFQKNEKQIYADIEILKKSDIHFKEPSATNTILGNQVYIHPTAQVECSILNSNTGPIYIGENVEIMEGCMVRGGLAMLQGSALKMGTKIYGATTIGPYSKVGGEVNNSVIFGYSNKAHDGFLGNSVIGTWCNLGADTNNSNLKNNYSEVSVWDYESNNYINTQHQFVGLCMGDHAKAGINTMFNTGTVVGAFANIYGGDFPEKFIPDFYWGSAHSAQVHEFNKAMDMAKRVMERRGVQLTEELINVYQNVFDSTQEYRKAFT